jgi:hypothetical protein
MVYSVANTASTIGTAVNVIALVSIAVPVAIVGFLYYTFTTANWENSTVSTVVADDGTITTKRTIP